jgi:hypothetical protein
MKNYKTRFVCQAVTIEKLETSTVFLCFVILSLFRKM